MRPNFSNPGPSAGHSHCLPILATPGAGPGPGEILSPGRSLPGMPSTNATSALNAPQIISSIGRFAPSYAYIYT